MLEDEKGFKTASPSCHPRLTWPAWAQLAGGLTCVLQSAAAGGGPNCVAQMCHQAASRDVLALFLLGAALCAVAALGLARVPQKLAAAARRATYWAAKVRPLWLLAHHMSAADTF